MQNLHIARRQKSRSSAEQSSMQSIKEMLQEEPGILIICFASIFPQSRALQRQELLHAELANSTQAKEQRRCNAEHDKRNAAVCFNFCCRRYPG